MNYTWIPFYKEFSQKLLKYKDNRMPLINWIYDTLKRCRKFYQAYENAVIGATPLPQLEISDEKAMPEGQGERDDV